MNRLLGIAAILSAAGAAYAQNWTTSGDFSVSSNPAGRWSYGWRDATTGTFSLFDRQVLLTENLAGWSGSQFPLNAPMVGQNPTGTPQTIPGTTIVVPPESVWGRPGANGESAVFRFTAPAAGNYTISGIFREIDTAAGARISVLVRGDTLLGINLPTEGLIVMDPPGPIPLAAGDTVEFVVGAIAGSSGGAMAVQGRLGRALTCYPNCDLSTTAPFLNVADFVCFLNRFAAGDDYANCDGSTTPPILTVNDFSCFLNSFAAGCSAP